MHIFQRVSNGGLSSVDVARQLTMQADQVVLNNYSIRPFRPTTPFYIPNAQDPHSPLRQNPGRGMKWQADSWAAPQVFQVGDLFVNPLRRKQLSLGAVTIGRAVPLARDGSLLMPQNIQNVTNIIATEARHFSAIEHLCIWARGMGEVGIAPAHILSALLYVTQRFFVDANELLERHREITDVKTQPGFDLAEQGISKFAPAYRADGAALVLGAMLHQAGIYGETNRMHTRLKKKSASLPVLDMAGLGLYDWKTAHTDRRWLRTVSARTQVLSTVSAFVPANEYGPSRWIMMDPISGLSDLFAPHRALIHRHSEMAALAVDFSSLRFAVHTAEGPTIACGLKSNAVWPDREFVTAQIRLRADADSSRPAALHEGAEVVLSHRPGISSWRVVGYQHTKPQGDGRGYELAPLGRHSRTGKRNRNYLLPSAIEMELAHINREEKRLARMEQQAVLDSSRFKRGGHRVNV